MAVPGEVQRYIDRLKTSRTKLQRYADYTKPLHYYDQHVAAFRTQHGSTRAEANQAARQASQQAEEAHQQAEYITQQRRAELYQQARKQIGDQLAILHTLERQARNAGMFDFKGTKAKARQQREALEAEYGKALPRGKYRIKHHHATEDSHWGEDVAASITDNNLPTDPDVVEAQQQARQAAEDAQHATERSKYIAHQWDVEVGDKPDITLRRDRHNKPITYEGTQRRIQQLDQRISWAANSANQDQVVTALDNARQRRQAQAANKKPTRTPGLDPQSLLYQAAFRQPPTPGRGTDLGR